MNERLSFDFHPRTRLIFGDRSSDRLGDLAREAGFRRTLIVADRGLVAAGHIERATKLLEACGIEVLHFHDFETNPDSHMVEAGRVFASPLAIDSLVAFGGGSSLDCAKGINFLLTNGGRMQDYRGYGNASRPMLPMIAVPTTAGTGSEVQSYALIMDAETHAKMACGDAKAAFKIAILDPLLTVSQPKAVTAASGFDAIAHAVETAVTSARNSVSTIFSREAFRLLEPNFEIALKIPDNLDARRAMQLGACYSGLAIDASMLGAAHACANPVTALYGITHGVALGVLLPNLVRWNGAHVGDAYAELLRLVGVECNVPDAATALANRLRVLATAADLPSSLQALGVSRDDLPQMAKLAASEWTGTFNPRPFDASGALEVYTASF